MHDPLSAGRRLASRALGWQAGATVLVALAFLVIDARHGLAAAAGGTAVVVANAMAAWLSYRGGVQPAAAVLARWFAGVVVRWVIVVLGLGLCFAMWRLQPLPVLGGAFAALVAQGFGALRR